MYNLKIISPGKKLLEIRKKLKIKQNDITGGEIDRSLISLIENEKAALTPQVAKILAGNINALCLKKGIAFHVETDYLLESENQQAGKIADKFILYLEKSKETLPEDFESHLETIVLFLSKHKINRKEIEIYELIGDIFDKNTDYDRSFTYYLKAYENSFNSCDDIQVSRILFKLGICCILLNKYKEAAIFHKIALKNIDKIPESILRPLLFNDMLINKKLRNYDTALEQIAYIENNFTLDNADKFDVFTLKANCLKNKKNYKKALEIHESLLPLINEDELEKKLIVLCNITEIYTILNDTERAADYLNVLIQLSDKYSLMKYKIYSPDIYNEIGKGFRFIEDTNKAKEYFIKAFRAAQKYKNNDILLESFNNLFSIIKSENNTEQMDNLKLMFIEIMSLGLVSDPHIYILKFIEYYNSLKDSESIKKLLEYYYKFNR